MLFSLGGLSHTLRVSMVLVTLFDSSATSSLSSRFKKHFSRDGHISGYKRFRGFRDFIELNFYLT